MTPNFGRVKLGCYLTNISMAVVSSLSPILFLTFHQMYGISYSQLGLLVLVNFVTQLLVDLAFSFFSHKFNIPLSVKMTPVITVVGLLVYALSPFIFGSSVYIGLLIGTVIFSASGGLAEVLISPVIAAIPSDNPDREMSKLHSIYAWGVVGVIIFSTLFLYLVGGDYWWVLALIFMLIPAAASVAFFGSTLPTLDTPEKVTGVLSYLRQGTLWLCVIGIFCGGATECTMAQWSSGYLEMALGLPKLWGDILGVAFFAVMLGLGRTLYSKFGKRIYRVLIFGSLGAAICYITASLSGIAVVGLVACALTGFCASMLWPGSLIVASEKFPGAGVFIYALMAAGGDLGASVAPQLVGVITDAVVASESAQAFADSLGLAPDQLGMKLGMLVGMVFALVGTIFFIALYRQSRRDTSDNT